MWYYASAGDYEGPFQEAFIGRKLRAGVISKSTLVWRDGMAEWLPLAETELIHLVTGQAAWHGESTSTSPPPPPAGSPKQPEEHQSWQRSDREQQRDDRQQYRDDRQKERLQERDQQRDDRKQEREQQREERRQESSSLGDYEQSGYEQPQKGRPAPSQKAGRKVKRQAPAAKVGPVQDLSNVTNVVCFLFALSALLSAIFFVKYTGNQYGAFEPFNESISSAQSLLKLMGLVNTVAGLTFLVWVYRAISNLAPLGARSIDLLPGWVVISFFIPIVSFFVPFISIRKLWRASHSPRDWPKQPVAPLVTLLWLAWVFGSDNWGRFVLSGYRDSSRGTEYHFYLGSDTAALWPFVLNVATDVMVILLVRAIWQAQRAKTV